MRAWIDRLAALVLYGLSLALVVSAVKYAQFGFDFTDEGYHLVWMKDPFFYSFSISQAGYVYSPLFHELSQNVYWVRVANIIITYSLGVGLALSVLNEAAPALDSRFLRVALVCALATGSVIFLSWLPATPSYNNLNMQALMITAIGIMHARQSLNMISLAGWMLIGVGGWLAFMAKLSTAAALAPFVLLLMLVAGSLILRGLAIAMGVAALLVVVAAIGIDGSLSDFLDRILGAMQIYALSGAGYTVSDIFRLNNPLLTRGDLLVAAVTAIFLIVSSIVFARRSLPVSSLFIAPLLACSLGATLIEFRLVPLGFGGASLRTVLLTLPMVAFARALLDRFRQKQAAPNADVSLEQRRCRVVGVGFLFMPLVYAFGSNKNYWHLGGDAGLFWVLAGVFFAAPRTAKVSSFHRLLPLALMVPVLSMYFLQHGFSKPYRQPQPLWQNNHPTALGAPTTTLILSEGFSAYIDEAKSAAQRAGYEVGTPLIDLSGQSPGLLFAMGARSVGYPWLSGGYPGSSIVARSAIGRGSCTDLARAWLLLEPGGPREIESAVLNVFGADIGDFVRVAEWQTAKGAGGYLYARTQLLLRPARDPVVAASACVQAGLQHGSDLN